MLVWNQLVQILIANDLKMWRTQIICPGLSRRAALVGICSSKGVNAPLFYHSLNRESAQKI